MESEILLETIDLVKTFGDQRAVDGLNLHVRAGEIVGLVGPDGAGKTTTMRLLCGVLKPTSGRIRVAGYELPAQIEPARQHIGYLAQHFSLYGDLTVAENLDFFGEVFDMPLEVSAPAFPGAADLCRAGEIFRPSGGGALRWDAEKARIGNCAGAQPAGAIIGRADRRRRPGCPAGILALAGPAFAHRLGSAGQHALYG